jgi:hypothetical protein
VCPTEYFPPEDEDRAQSSKYCVLIKDRTILHYTALLSEETRIAEAMEVSSV